MLPDISLRWWPKSRRGRALLFMGFFAVTSALYLWFALPQGADTIFYGTIRGDAPLKTLVKFLGTNDQGSYLTAAVDLQHGGISAAHQWILNLWPPGMPSLLALLIAILGGGSPLVAMACLVCVVWALVSSLMVTILLPRLGYISAASFIVLWSLSPIFTTWTIRWGVLASDGLSTALAALVAIGLLWATLTPISGRRAYFLFGGIGVALAALAYLRALWAYAVLAAIVILVIGALARVVLRRLRRKAGGSSMRSQWGRWATLIAVFVALCVPWTVYVGTTQHPGSVSWSENDYQWQFAWQSDKYLDSEGATFLREGGANWPCHLEPATCQAITTEELATATPFSGQLFTYTQLEHLALKAAVANPGPFLANRLEVTYSAWLSNPGESVLAFNNPVFGILLLLVFLAALAMLVVSTIRARPAALFLLALLAGNVGAIWLTHLESRYFMPLQAIALVVVAFGSVGWEQRLWRRLARQRDRQDDRSPSVVTD